jgi:iron(III) transport system permease protein
MTTELAPATTRPVLARLRPANPFAWVAWIVALAYVLLLVYTIGGMVVRLIVGGDGAAAVSDALNGRGLLSAITNSSILLVTAVPLALGVSVLFAWLNERTDASMGLVSGMLPLLPFFLPPVALSIGWVFLGSEQAGFLNAVLDKLGLGSLWTLNIASWPGLIFVYVLYLVPYGYLIVSAALRNVDSAQDEASRMSGAGIFRTARKVSLPAIVPGIGSAALIIVVSCLALFAIPAIVGTTARITVLPVYIVRLVRESYPPRLDEAVVLSLFVFLVVGSVWLLQRRLAARARHTTIGGKSGGHSVIRLGRWRWPARILMLAYLAATSILPALALLLVALQPFWSKTIDWAALTLANVRDLLVTDGEAREALLTSGLLGVVGATVGMIVAAVIAVHGRQQGGRIDRLLDGATKLPGAMSHVVIGVAFVVSLGAAPFWWQGTLMILLLAYILVYMPQASIAAGSANDQIGNDLLEASRMSGARAGRTFLRVNLPLMVAGLSAGWALLFVRIVGDLTVTALLAGNNNPVVGYVILTIYEHGTYSTLAVMALAVTVVSGLLVGAVLAFGKRAR